MLSAPACASQGTLDGGGGAPSPHPSWPPNNDALLLPSQEGCKSLASPAFQGPRTADFVRTCLLGKPSGEQGLAFFLQPSQGVLSPWDGAGILSLPRWRDPTLSADCQFWPENSGFPTWVAQERPGNLSEPHAPHLQHGYNHINLAGQERRDEE